MATFLDTQDISSEIAKLIKNSKQRLYLITPYLKLNRQIKPYIKDLVYRIPNIDIIVVCRSDKINVEDMGFLQDLKNVKTWALDNLHAKCYMNEEIAIISSMNLHDYSERNNHEMGIKIDKNVGTDEQMYNEIYKDISIIMRESKKYEIKQIETVSPTVQKNAPVKNYPSQSAPSQKLKMGYCIRCGSEISFNQDKPLCSKCHSIWAIYSDPTYHENCCHVCGKESKQSVEKPVCYSCYKKLHK